MGHLLIRHERPELYIDVDITDVVHDLLRNTQYTLYCLYSYSYTYAYPYCYIESCALNHVNLSASPHSGFCANVGKRSEERGDGGVNVFTLMQTTGRKYSNSGSVHHYADCPDADLLAHRGGFVQP